jgi:acyl-CoA synthetase (AMP-forming)/AMP-acid ligase II
MSPLEFLQRPIRWLRGVSKYRATTSGGPNFAYDVCVRRIKPADCQGIDLSSWDVAFNGAEPVRRSTVDAFVKAFEGFGFRREAFYPCYGLAEGTLAVSGGAKAAAPILRSFASEPLERHHAVPAVEGEGATQASWFVGCGQPDRGHTLLIVDPEARTECPPDRIGEIWLSGESVARGYWNHEQDTEESFRARLADGRGPFLRTGDLGFVVDGELFVTGRLKDVLVVQGRNYYPTDIEVAGELAHPDLRRSCSAAFTVEIDDRERLVMVHEVEAGRPVDHEAVVLAIRSAVVTAVDLQAHTIVLIGARSLPKTSSGKVQRWLCRSQFLTRALDVVHQWSLAGGEETRPQSLGAEPRT